jgi:glycosyltransferase involved in cell wall biosynthesis
MVIDESCILGVPILTTRTNSSDEMVTERGCGWVCENSQEALDDKLFDILSAREALHELKMRMLKMPFDNSLALSQFHNLLET